MENTEIITEQDNAKQPRSIAIRPSLEKLIAKFAEDNRWSFSSAIEFFAETVLKNEGYITSEN